MSSRATEYRKLRCKAKQITRCDNVAHRERKISKIDKQSHVNYDYLIEESLFDLSDLSDTENCASMSTILTEGCETQEEKLQRPTILQSIRECALETNADHTSVNCLLSKLRFHHLKKRRKDFREKKEKIFSMEEKIPIVRQKMSILHKFSCFDEEVGGYRKFSSDSLNVSSAKKEKAFFANSGKTYLLEYAQNIGGKIFFIGKRRIGFPQLLLLSNEFG